MVKVLLNMQRLQINVGTIVCFAQLRNPRNRIFHEDR